MSRKDKERRTIAGFEKLISKEWIYLSGLENSYGSKPLDIALFNLFLDSVWQLLIQNDGYFEFTSLYLIRLFDLQTLPFKQEEVVRTQEKEKSFNDPSNSGTPVTLFNLNLTQLLFIYNAFYSSANNSGQSSIKFNSNPILLTFWKSFYLRWFPLSHHLHYYSYCPSSEYIQYSFILSKFSNFLSRPKLSSFSDVKKNLEAQVDVNDENNEGTYVSYL